MLLEKQPYCIYCGGVNKATTIDHMPPKVIFDGKDRPQGLEFPACEPCNSGGRSAEQVAGMLSRAYPRSPSTENNRELRRLIKDVRNNHPSMIDELRPSESQHLAFVKTAIRVPDDGNLINIGGPKVAKALNIFAAKFAFAMHYEIAGKIVSRSGVAAVRYFSNSAIFAGLIPQQIRELVGDPGTLVQGRKHVKDQFEYAGGCTQDKSQSVFVAQFRRSFLITGIVFDDGQEPPEQEGRHLYRPGFLRS
jgi:hypothetical protein